MNEGPSPRVRGKHHRDPPPEREAGSIPASAGETWSTASEGTGFWVHPRECGGNVHQPSPNSWCPGPSPRVRGKPRRRSPAGASGRSIPASAGETMWRCSFWIASTVHPRECGGNCGALVCAVVIWGPSPRVRGKQLLAPVGIESGRSIPASAGETAAHTARQSAASVHPRECGGNRRAARCPPPGPGPSPRVRGKRRICRRKPSGGGSIPASAGETRESRVIASPERVHPRECGGNFRKMRRVHYDVGPSPRVRGKQLDAHQQRAGGRSIPASAGETVRE